MPAKEPTVASDLSSIPGLRPKHEAVLTGPLRIRTALDLARADRRAVHAAMRRLRPAPTLEDIANWQDIARDLAATARAEPPGSPGWEQVAAFVVSFETRPTAADPERRVVVEQVEQAPPEPRQEWPAWSPEAAWTWMLERVAAGGEGVGEGDDDAEPVRRERPGRAPVATGGPGPGAETRPESSGPTGRAPRAIAVGAMELVLAAGLVRRLDAAGPAVDIPPQAVLRVTATSVPDLPLQVALRLRREGGPSYAPSPPVTAVSGEAAEIDLDRLPAGEHAAVLTIWAARGKAAAAVIPLPRLSVPQRP
jgi:hypothetical protein